MKKLTSTFFLVSILFLTTTAFADGDIPNNGFTGDIPNGAGVTGDIPNNGFTGDMPNGDRIFLPSLIVKIQESLRFLIG